MHAALAAHAHRIPNGGITAAINRVMSFMIIGEKDRLLYNRHHARRNGS